MKGKSIIQTLILTALGVVFVWFAYGQIEKNKEDIISAFANADYFWVFMCAFIAFLSHVVRAFRWNYLLEPLGYKISFLNACAAVFIGYFGNYAPVIRFGEVYRATIINRYEKIPFQTGFGTIITERLVDTLLLFVIFGLTLLFQFRELIGLSNKYIFDPLGEKYGNMSTTKVIIIGFIALSGIVAFIALRKKIAGKLQGKFGNFIKGFFDGLLSIRKMKNFGAFAFFSVLIWTMYFYSAYFCMKALPETTVIGHKECLTIMLFGTLGVVFSPGGLGAYHLIVAGILTYYGISDAPSVALPWLIWTASFFMVCFFGLLSLILLPIVNKNKNVVQQQAE
jgi:uncharacterized protein (TIRG00374 family)